MPTVTIEADELEALRKDARIMAKALRTIDAADYPYWAEMADENNGNPRLVLECQEAFNIAATIHFAALNKEQK